MPKAQGPPDLPHDLPDYQRGVIEELRAGPALVTSNEVMRVFRISRPQAVRRGFEARAWSATRKEAV